MSEFQKHLLCTRIRESLYKLVHKQRPKRLLHTPRKVVPELCIHQQIQLVFEVVDLRLGECRAPGRHIVCGEVVSAGEECTAGIIVGEIDIREQLIEAFGDGGEIDFAPFGSGLYIRCINTYSYVQVQVSRRHTLLPPEKSHFLQVFVGVIQDSVTLFSAIVENAVAFKLVQARPKYPWANH